MKSLTADSSFKLFFMEMIRTLIVYATRHGHTAEYARQLLGILNGNVDLCYIDEREVMPDLDVYDTIVIGGSIKFGKINESISQFCINNLEQLKTKRLGLFISCFFEDTKALEQLNRSFPKELLDIAVVADYFNGEILMSQLKPWERFIAKIVLKAEEKEYFSNSQIINFANRLNI